MAHDHASQKKLISIEKQINSLNIQRPSEIEGYAISHYDYLNLDPSDKGLNELWNNPEIIAHAGNFMLMPQNHVWTLRDNTNPDTVASCIRFGIEENYGLIDQLATNPAYQGKGLAKKLMEEVEFF